MANLNSDSLNFLTQLFEMSLGYLRAVMNYESLLHDFGDVKLKERSYPSSTP